jgi:UDP-N-acetylmuramate dehydrogenase
MAQHGQGARARRNSEGISTSSLTTLGVGGWCDAYSEVRSLTELESVSTRAAEAGLRTLIIGEGSNLLFSDSGFAGQIIRNRILGRERSGLEVEIGGGESLSEVIGWLNQQGLAGMERMYGIPGTVAGALVGNAGAYGQEIGDTVVQVDAWIDGSVESFTQRALELDYRHSFFKSHSGWFILKCRLNLRQSNQDLELVSKEILERRLVKYPAGLKCPGSFFKNVIAREIAPEAQRLIPHDFVIGGKIPAGKLLEAVGACGARRGQAEFADYHGNLIVNRGKAKCAEILSLANEYAGRVNERFRIRLEPEILIIDDREWPNLKPARERG